ncbi:sensor histidine kinase [Clavibacter sp. km3a]|uniref:sensor histidine kinase n=1 Tax=Clavibacter sp. km3a TaxID=3459135 RepID=UPI004041B35A
MPSPTAPAPRGLTRSIGREAALIAASLAVGLVALGATLDTLAGSGASGLRTEALLLLDVAAGILAIALMPLRRHAPVAVAATLGVLAAMSSLAILAAVIALVSVATRRRPREIALVVAVWVVAIPIWELAGLAHLPLEQGDLPFLAIALLVGVGLPVVIGLYVGGRRELLASLRERARMAEEEQALRLEQAADHERTRIAREMHDVLAHRLSLVALHAGALEYRDDLDGAEVRQTATIVRENARTALTELREVLGVLRDPSGSPAVAPPQPTLADLPELLDDAGSLGTEVRLDLDPGTRADLPRLGASVSRHAYRIVQECLTNARRHAPGAPVDVSIAGRPGGVLRVVVRNALTGGDPGPASPGHGLAGIAERARSVDGTLVVAVRDDAHVVEAELPWTA